jgi:hypothetical protein
MMNVIKSNDSAKQSIDTNPNLLTQLTLLRIRAFPDCQRATETLDLRPR